MKLTHAIAGVIGKTCLHNLKIAESIVAGVMEVQVDLFSRVVVEMEYRIP